MQVDLKDKWRNLERQGVVGACRLGAGRPARWRAARPARWLCNASGRAAGTRRAGNKLCCEKASVIPSLKGPSGLLCRLDCMLGA